MRRIEILAAAGAPVAVLAALAAPAFGAASKVSFRVEGVSKTLLAATSVAVPTSGSITQGGTPQGACPANTAAGAFNAATRGNWSGTYSKGLGIEVTKILGETGLYAKGHYWEFFVNNRAASVGICDQKVRAGDRLLFADVPAKGPSEFPIVISAPVKATAGSSFAVRASYYPKATGKAKPLAGVSFAGVSGKTNAKGVASVTARKPGKLSLVGAKRGEIRSAAATVVVAK